MKSSSGTWTATSQGQRASAMRVKIVRLVFPSVVMRRNGSSPMMKPSYPVSSVSRAASASGSPIS
ncbi:MAG: hypothetical protein AAFQ33_17205, partial [Pseudomonadota bacterium]